MTCRSPWACTWMWTLTVTCSPDATARAAACGRWAGTAGPPPCPRVLGTGAAVPWPRPPEADDPKRRSTTPATSPNAPPATVPTPGIAVPISAPAIVPVASASSAVRP